MKSKFNLLLSNILLLFMMGCASSYHTIRPETLRYSTGNSDSTLVLNYRYDVLSESGNKKYAKHEKLRSVKLVALKITNFTGQTINLRNDVSYYVGNREVFPMDPTKTKQELKQGVAVYLLYLLMTPMNVFTTTTESNGYGNYEQDTKTFPIGLVLGPGISLGNMIVAGSANSEFETELNTFSITHSAGPGQTIYILAGFRDIGYEPITIKIRK